MTSHHMLDDEGLPGVKVGFWNVDVACLYIGFKPWKSITCWILNNILITTIGQKINDNISYQKEETIINETLFYIVSKLKNTWVNKNNPRF